MTNHPGYMKDKHSLKQPDLLLPTLFLNPNISLKYCISGNIEVTNDGATILRGVGVDNPAAKVLVEMSRVQDSEVGDGTTSVTVLASELIREAEKLIDMRIHPQTIIAGWRKASAAAKEALEVAQMAYDKASATYQEMEDKLLWAFQGKKAKIELSLRFGVRTRTRCAH